MHRVKAVSNKGIDWAANIELEWNQSVDKQTNFANNRSCSENVNENL